MIYNNIKNVIEIKVMVNKNGKDALKMDTRAEVLVVDYENDIPKAMGSLQQAGYRIRVARDNQEAASLLLEADVVIALVTDRKRECLKLMEHVHSTLGLSVNFITIMGGPEDRPYMERVSGLSFQSFRKYRFGLTELTQAVNNAVEMRRLKDKERTFLNDLTRVEEELKRVENRLYTISAIKRAVQNRNISLN